MMSRIFLKPNITISCLVHIIIDHHIIILHCGVTFFQWQILTVSKSGVLSLLKGNATNDALERHIFDDKTSTFCGISAPARYSIPSNHLLWFSNVR